MISLIKELPAIKEKSAELVKIRCLFDVYKTDGSTLFWAQDGGRALISMTDGNMVIFNNSADTKELAEFVDFMSPACVFSDYDTLIKINRKPEERINIVYRKADIPGETLSDELNSREIYDLLDVDGLSLPEYPYFAVDYCRRLNMGKADCFALAGKCAAVTFNCEDMAVMNGIASREKGYGTVALKAVLQKNYGRDFFVCCRDSVLGFYKKNGFSLMYYGGYWVRDI